MILFCVIVFIIIVCIFVRGSSRPKDGTLRRPGGGLGADGHAYNSAYDDGYDDACDDFAGPGRGRLEYYDDPDDYDDFDEDRDDDYVCEDDYPDEDYPDYETAAARGDRDYFSDDMARDYASYHSQLDDDDEDDEDLYCD